MDPTEKELSKLDSMAETLQAIRSEYDNPIQFITSMRRIFDMDGEHIDPNYTQLDRIMRMIALQDGADAWQTYQDMMHGACVAFELLMHTAKKGEDIRAKVYSGLGSLESLALNQADRYALNRPIAIGESLLTIYDNDLIFKSTIATDEQEFIFGIITDLKKDLASQYDALRGYTLVRLIIPWAENHRAYVSNTDRGQLLEIADSTGPSRPESTPDSDFEKEKAESDFFDIVGGLEYDMDTLEGLEDCTEDVTLLVASHLANVAYMAQGEMRDPNVAESVASALQEAYFTEFMSLKNLKLRDQVTIVGNTVLTLTNKEGEVVDIKVASDQSTIRGTIAEPTILTVFTQTFVDAAISGDEELKRVAEAEEINSFGATLLIDNFTSTSQNGTTIHFEEEYSVHVSIEHHGVKVYRDPYAYLD
jgi:hypothetical protein